PTIPAARPGPEGAREYATLYRGAFPDLHMDIDDQVGEDDLVVTRWTLTGTQNGAFGDIPATGRPIRVKGITIYRFDKGKVAEEWMNWDALGLLQQLGPAGPPGNGPEKQISGPPETGGELQLDQQLHQPDADVHLLAEEAKPTRFDGGNALKPAGVG